MQKISSNNVLSGILFTTDLLLDFSFDSYYRLISEINPYINTKFRDQTAEHSKDGVFLYR